MKIESLNNEKVKKWCQLKEKKYRDKTNLFLVEGDHLVNEALKKGAVKEIIALDKQYEVANIPFYEVTLSVMKKLSTQVSFSKVMAVCEKMKEQIVKGRVCLLDNIQDPGNLGTIIRSALAFDIDTIILSPDTVDLYNEKVIRASEGMIFHLNFIKSDLTTAIKELKRENYQIYGTNVKNGISLKSIDFCEKSGIIIGNEGQGMKNELIPLCNQLINIPLAKTCESLNAGVAASIIFYELSQK